MDVPLSECQSAAIMDVRASEHVYRTLDIAPPCSNVVNVRLE